MNTTVYLHINNLLLIFLLFLASEFFMGNKLFLYYKVFKTISRKILSSLEIKRILGVEIIHFIEFV